MSEQVKLQLVNAYFLRFVLLFFIFLASAFRLKYYLSLVYLQPNLLHLEWNSFLMGGKQLIPTMLQEMLCQKEPN